MNMIIKLTATAVAAAAAAFVAVGTSSAAEARSVPWTSARRDGPPIAGARPRGVLARPWIGEPSRPRRSQWGCAWLR